MSMLCKLLMENELVVFWLLTRFLLQTLRQRVMRAHRLALEFWLVRVKRLAKRQVRVKCPVRPVTNLHL